MKKNKIATMLLGVAFTMASCQNNVEDLSPHTTSSVSSLTAKADPSVLNFEYIQDNGFTNTGPDFVYRTSEIFPFKKWSNSGENEYFRAIDNTSYEALVHCKVRVSTSMPIWYTNFTTGLSEYINLYIYKNSDIKSKISFLPTTDKGWFTNSNLEADIIMQPGDKVFFATQVDVKNVSSDILVGLFLLGGNRDLQGNVLRAPDKMTITGLEIY